MTFNKSPVQFAGEVYVDTLTVEQIKTDVNNRAGGIKLDCSLEEAKRWTAFKFESRVNAEVSKHLNKIKQQKRVNNDK